MPEVTWVADRTKIHPRTVSDPDAQQVATYFKLLADVVDSVTLDDGSHCSENLVLLLSTCRNSFLTVNAIFEDISRIFGHGYKQHLQARAVDSLRGKNVKAADKLLAEAIFLLDEAMSKYNIWNNRDVLWNAFEKHLRTKVDLTTAGMLRGLINEVRVSDLTEMASRNMEYLRIDMSDKPSLDIYYAEILKIFDGTRSIICVLQAISKCSSDASLLDLMRTEKDQTSIRGFSQLVETIKEYGDKIGLRIEPKAKDSEFIIRHRKENTEVILTMIDDTRLAADQYNLILDVVDYEIRKLYDMILNGPFLLNTPRSPLPRPFKLDLRPTGPIHNSSLGPISARQISCKAEVLEPERVKIALYDGGIDESFYNDERVAFKDDNIRSKVRKFLFESINSACSHHALCVVFPECFIPNNCCIELQGISTTKNIVIIGGLESSWSSDGKRQNRAIICMPGNSDPSYQFKQRPSRFEIRIEDFKSDGIVNVYYNSPIGCFSVLVCSDILELDVLWALAESNRMPEIVFVCTMNPYPKMFESIIYADAYRLYAYMAQINNRDVTGKNDGTGQPGAMIISPLNPREPNAHDEEESIALDKSLIQSSYPPSLRLFNLDLNKIRKRSHDVPARGFCHVPHYRNRIG